MSARDAILSAIRRNAPDAVAHPGTPDGVALPDAVSRFRSAMEAGGGTVADVAAGGDLQDAVRAAFPDAERVASAADGVGGTVALTGAPHALAELDLFVCRGVLGVAENGAIWLPESRLTIRAAPFLAPHVAVILDRDAVVATMHDAYAQVGDAEGFGVFVAGPSKTADIEQSLVVGAHGPLSLTVLLVSP